jgi:hypothetical protein
MSYTGKKVRILPAVVASISILYASLLPAGRIKNYFYYKKIVLIFYWIVRCKPPLFPHRSKISWLSTTGSVATQSGVVISNNTV